MPLSPHRLLLFVTAIALLFCVHGDAQNVPPGNLDAQPAALVDAPQAQRQRPRWDFYAANGYMLAAVVADERLSVWGVRRGCMAEGNPRYRMANGRVNSGKYYRDNLTIAAGVAVVSYIVQRYARGHPEARAIVAMAALGEGASHTVAVAEWVKLCG